MYLFTKLVTITLLGSIALSNSASLAQIVPDQTLGSESSVIQPNQLVNGIKGNIINGGAIRSSSLFHSFHEFNVDIGSAAYFSNPAGIENIFTRITRGNTSKISGTLGVLGNANLFLLNPNGIIFTSGAALDINGSFLATTADSIKFSDGSVFSAKIPQQLPLLTINIPTSINFSGTPGSIEVYGEGHNIVQVDNPFTPRLKLGTASSGLEVNPGKTLSLLGGNVSLYGGIMSAPSGQIEVGSVQSGKVKLIPNISGFSLNYDETEALSDISLSRASLIDVSGVLNNNVQVYGKNIDITDTSLIHLANYGLGPVGNININATGTLTISRFSQLSPPQPSFTQVAEGIVSETFEGKGANINVNARQVLAQNSGSIYSLTFGSGEGGTITIGSSGSPSSSIHLLDSPFKLIGATSLFTSATLGTGRAGGITINGELLSIEGGNQVSSIVFGEGLGGDVVVNTSNLTKISGFIPGILSSSLLSSITIGSGNAGNLVINTQRLEVDNGGRVDASTLGFGNSGSIDINASDSISLSGVIPGSINPSLIISSANIVDSTIREILGLPFIPTGDSGSIKIRTGQLNITDGAELTVRNDGLSNAGNLSIDADSIDLNNQADITASTAGGKGGNIFLRLNNLLSLRNGSSVTASALGNGDGGNIIINPDLVVLQQGSSISANAEQGSGGLVSVTAKGLFVSPDSSISAISNRGVTFDGIVEINTPNQDFARAAALPVSPPQAPEVASVCQGRPGTEPGQLVKAGTGGIPRSPDDLLNKRSGWHQPSAAEAIQAAVLDNPNDPEVQGWIIYPDRTMQFTTKPGVFYAPIAALPCTTAQP